MDEDVNNNNAPEQFPEAWAFEEVIDDFDIMMDEMYWEEQWEHSAANAREIHNEAL